MLIEPDGNIWAAGYGGLFFRQPNGKVKAFRRPRRFSGPRPQNIVVRDRRGPLWAGARGGGLARLALKRKPGQRFLTCFSRRKAAFQYGHPNVSPRLDGVFLGWPYQGLSHWKPGDSAFPANTSYGDAHGLTDPRVYRVVEDR